MEITTRFSVGQPVWYCLELWEIEEVVASQRKQVHNIQYTLINSTWDVSPIEENVLSSILTNEPDKDDIVCGNGWWEKGLSCMLQQHDGSYDVRIRWYDNENSHRIPRSEMRMFDNFDDAIDFLCSR